MTDKILKKILIVDDEPDVSDMLKLFLENSGYTVLTAGQASEALNIVDLENPRVVLLDIVMPDMDGIECLKQIKKTHPETIVIILSGLQDEGIAQQAIRYGAYDYIAKPFDLTSLRENVLARLF